MRYQFLVVLFLSLSSCAVRVNSLYDPNVVFDNYESFCWLEGCEFTYSGPSYLNDSTLREYIKSSIIENLSSKGLNQNSEDPDLLIDFHIIVENETMVIYHEDEEEDFLYQNEEESKQYIDYLKGTLIIDIVDKDEGRMIWRSAAIQYMDINPKLTKKNIRKGIARALKDYPPKPPK